MSQKQRSMLFQSMARRPRKPSAMSQKKAPMFFKFMLPGFSQKLCLPRAFLKNLKGDKCDKAILNSPLGKSWHVKVCGGNACMWFADGWFDFVQGHDLQLGECLVFRYDGDMVFYVIVFATSASEKRLPVFKKDDKDDGKQRGTEDEKKSPLVREKVKDKGKQRGQHVSTVKINSFKKIKTEDSELPMYKTDSVGARHVSKKHPSIAEEKRKAFEKANAFSRASKFPNFLKVMKKVSVGKCFTCFVMNVPSSFSREHLPKEKVMLFLWDPKGRACEVTFTPGNNRNGYLSGGWSEFSRAHNLREGDVCIFELIGECQLQVHIFPWKMPAFAQSKRRKKLSQ
ncbi:hypothetical protein AAC387_Pa02g3491 [Persea americana]